ncbi:MAG: EthD family reductase [Thermodesulfobacteriota bacterium]
MIHQLIFAAPKPGMTAREFHDYWVNIHAVKYAAKIPQIKRYLIDTRIPFEGDLGAPVLPHQGVAEIWLENEADQLASLQSREFLEGARLDEPNWAAFWLTLVLDTAAHAIVPGPPLTKDPAWIKLLMLLKRQPGVPLENFRGYNLQVHAPVVAALPGLQRYWQCHTRDGFYVFGEARFDGVEQLWFENVAALRRAWNSAQFQEVKSSLVSFVDPKHTFTLVTEEHWIIGPESR